MALIVLPLIRLTRIGLLLIELPPIMALSTPPDLPPLYGVIPPNAYSTAIATQPNMGQQTIVRSVVGRSVQIIENSDSFNITVYILQM